MKTYAEMAAAAKPESAAALAHVLLRIYEADRTKNCGAVNGEAVLSPSFATEARYVLMEAGVLPRRSGLNVVRGPVPGSEENGDKIAMYRSEF